MPIYIVKTKLGQRLEVTEPAAKDAKEKVQAILDDIGCDDYVVSVKALVKDSIHQLSK